MSDGSGGDEGFRTVFTIFQNAIPPGSSLFMSLGVAEELSAICSHPSQISRCETIGWQTSSGKNLRFPTWRAGSLWQTEEAGHI